MARTNTETGLGLDPAPHIRNAEAYLPPRVPEHVDLRLDSNEGAIPAAELLENLDTEELLGRPPRVAITDKSGTDGLVHWVNEFFGLKGDDRINKIKIHKVARWVIDQYDVHGRLTAISDQELEAKVKELLPDYWEKYKGG